MNVKINMQKPFVTVLLLCSGVAAFGQPQITVQPQSQAIFASQIATLTVEANGTPPLSYQWQYLSHYMAGAWYPIDAATNSTLSLDGSSGFVQDSYRLSVIASDSFGSIQSSNVLVTAYSLPTTQPSSASLLVGADATFSVSYEIINGPLPSGIQGDQPWPAQWQFNGTNIAGATSYSYTVPDAQLTNAGSYAYVITNPLGSITSQPAILQVLPPGAPSIEINNQLAVGTVAAVVSTQLIISGGFTNGFIFYTLDGTTPNTSSPLYTGPVTLTSSATVQAMSLSADFLQTAFAPAVTVQIIPVYNLEASVVGSGTITVGPTNGPYASNTVVVLTANAAAGWALDHWAGDLTGSQNPVSLTMNGPRSVQAVFGQTAYPLTATTAGGGILTANGQIISPATLYPTGSEVTLNATASDGWSFMGWQGDATGTNNPLSVTMSQPNNITDIP